MQFFAAILPAAVLLASGVSAWAPDANGNGIANNVYHNVNGVQVHEACTVAGKKNSASQSGPCAYWADGVGTIHNGKCKYNSDDKIIRCD